MINKETVYTYKRRIKIRERIGRIEQSSFVHLINDTKEFTMMTRRQLRSQRQQDKNNKQLNKTKTKKSTTAEHKARRSERRREGKSRQVPRWMRLGVLFIAILIALISGMIIGYGIIGDGNPLDALRLDTWKHIIDIVRKE